MTSSAERISRIQEFQIGSSAQDRKPQTVCCVQQVKTSLEAGIHLIAPFFNNACKWVY